MENVQCPNCGGYRVKNRGDGSSNNKAAAAGILLLLAFVTYGLTLLLIPFCFLIPNSKPREDGSIEYACELCGYKWFHIPGTPWPAINVNPELIREGAEKLRQEEEERQRRRRMND